MKKIFVMSLTFALVIAASIAASAQNWKDDDSDFGERDEFRQTYQLTAGSRVELKGINGSVEIETWNGNSAEVHVVRLARNKEDLDFHKILVEAGPSSLVVRGEKDREGWRGRNREVRQRVTLKIPRQVDFHVSGINGRVRAGEIDGTLHASGINGSVEVAQAIGYAEISGVNGRVTVTIAKLGERGINVDGINGGVEIQFADDLNADLEVTGCNGRVYADVPNVTMLGKVTRDNFRARIGSGGTRISVSGVNGRVRLARAG